MKGGGEADREGEREGGVSKVLANESRESSRWVKGRGGGEEGRGGEGEERRGGGSWECSGGGREGASRVSGGEW